MAKALARAGVASRREVERLINLGKVAVNGRVLDTPAVLVKRDDILTVDGEVVNGPEPTRLWRYHKPAGLVTTHKDPQGRPTVFEHLPQGLPRVISIGRLDLNSEGLLLLTNDGALSRALELPSSGWRRVYRARAFGRATQADLDRLKDGITLEGVRYGPIEAKLDKAEAKADGRANLWLTVSLAEGKNREVRRVLEALGLKVNRLIRLAYGPFQLATLEPGAAEEIGPRVIREQLAELIAPENLPRGDRTAAPPAARPGRRPSAGPAVPRGTGDPLADPGRKPSRTRAQLAAARAELDRPPERTGAPERTGKPYGKGGVRPRREGGDAPPDRGRPARPSRPPGKRWDDRGDAGEAPARGPRSDKPFAKGGFRPRRDDGDPGGRPARASDPPGKRWDRQATGETSGPRPDKPYGRGPRSDKPYAKGGVRPRRDEAAGDGERPARAGRTPPKRFESRDGSEAAAVGKGRGQRPDKAGGGGFRPRTEDGDRRAEARGPRGPRKPGPGGRPKGSAPKGPRSKGPRPPR